jgi:L-amino acid N-acyltransferase YncA
VKAVIRPVEPSDAGEIATIYRPIVECSTISFEEHAPDEREMARRIAHVTQTYPWLVAVQGERLAGYAYASRHRERECYRYSVDVSVYVAPHARKAGIARALYETLFIRLAQLGFHRAFAGIALPNDASLALHRACGFEPVGVYKEVGWKFGSWVDVAWFGRAL